MTAPVASRLIHGDCVKEMQNLPDASIDFVLTDPPYLVNYRSRSGQTIRNDDNDRWIKPAFAEMHRVLKPNSYCVSFYGWSHADKFIDAWRVAGFRIVGHLVFRKRYASSTYHLRCQHEQAYLLAKGRPMLPADPIGDVLDWTYTGNRLHPTEKPVSALTPLITAFAPQGGLVLDPFCGSGSTLVAADAVGRCGLGIELDARHYQTAVDRLSPIRLAA